MKRINPRTGRPALRWTIAAAVFLVAVPVVAQIPERWFPDVPDDHRRIDAIRYAKDEGLFLGFPDGNLRPDDELSEGQFIKVAERLYDRYDVWTRAEWAQVMYEGLRSLTAAPTTTIAPPTTAAPTTTIAPPTTAAPTTTIALPARTRNAADYAARAADYAARAARALHYPDVFEANSTDFAAAASAYLAARAASAAAAARSYNPPSLSSPSALAAGKYREAAHYAAAAARSEKAFRLNLGLTGGKGDFLIPPEIWRDLPADHFVNLLDDHNIFQISFYADQAYFAAKDAAAVASPAGYVAFYAARADRAAADAADAFYAARAYRTALDAAVAEDYAADPRFVAEDYAAEDYLAAVEAPTIAADAADAAAEATAVASRAGYAAWAAEFAADAAAYAADTEELVEAAAAAYAAAYAADPRITGVDVTIYAAWAAEDAEDAYAYAAAVSS